MPRAARKFNGVVHGQANLQTVPVSGEDSVHCLQGYYKTKNGNLSTPFGVQGDLWLSTSSGLYRGTSSGSTWSQVTTVTSAVATGFGKAATGASYPTIYMSGTINGLQALYRSTDVGATWTQINDSAHQYGGIGYVTGDPKTFGTVYIAGTQGLGRGIIVGTSSN
jgi:hypothetical protein